MQASRRCFPQAVGQHVCAPGHDRGSLSQQAWDGEQDGPGAIQGRLLGLQMFPWVSTLGWEQRVVRVATGGLEGQLIPQVVLHCASGSVGGPGPFEKVSDSRKAEFLCRLTARGSSAPAVTACPRGPGLSSVSRSWQAIRTAMAATQNSENRP